MNKKAMDITLEQVVFLVLNILFFMLLLGFVARASSSALVAEEIYAKEIALIIDSMKPNTEVNISLSKLYNIARKNKYEGPDAKLIDHLPSQSLITVRVATGEGYSFHYFNNLAKFSLLIDEKNEILTIKS